ncbi:hypothetical protein H0H93_011549 [Arthromyces matolae]|nr:hypothetical protein H0H93_011549 [Arthromyces matolae]
MEQRTSSLAPPRQPQKSSATESSQQVAGSVAKRLGNELMTLMMSSSPGISAFPKSDGNLFEWIGTIEGPADTVYAGLAFRISISFPSNYPYVAPTIKFETPCYHPNFDLDKWSAVYSVQTILLSLQSLLGEPNNASPLNPEAAGLWNTVDGKKFLESCISEELYLIGAASVQSPGYKALSPTERSSIASHILSIIWIMRRRAPPSSLLLVPGPTPPRNTPKHKLPSVPLPTFYPIPSIRESTTPTRGRSRSFVLPKFNLVAETADEPACTIDTTAAVKQRGPWDHSGCIKLTIDVENVLAPLEPVAKRLNDTYDYDGNGNTRPQYHFATTSPAIHAQSAYNPLSLNQSPLKNKPIRSALPTQWLDNSNNSSDNRSLSPHNNSDFSSAGGSPPPMAHLNPLPLAPSTPSQNPDDDVIPTAIVIKNIPFNVKRETLLDIIASLSIPTPYAFNYHLDQQGSFRGLAFANFRQAQDADAVVAALNGFDVQGRKLRVEYKKVLQAGEKERIEREKAIRRMRSMQIEKEQHQQNITTPLYEDYGSALSSAFSPGRSYSSGSPYQPPQYSPPNPSSISTPSYGLSLNSAPAAPIQAPSSTTPSISGKSSADEVDLNDPSTLEIYSRILVFKEDRMRDELAFSRSLTAKQRRVVHLLAQKLGVYHYSIGEGDERYVVVTRLEPQRQQQPQVQQPSQRQAPHTLSRAPSAYLTPTSQVPPNPLRMKKSMPDMKTLHSQAPRLTSRASNSNIREGYATIASPSRRVSAGFSSLFSNGSPFGNGGSVPPVPSLPSSISSLNGGHETTSNVVRQPRGPGIGGFGRRDSRVSASETQSRGVLDARTYEPLEI